MADATGTIFGSLAGTSTVTSYIESVAGIAAGARTGLSNVFVAALFLLAMFCSPLAAAIPGYATSPALILVGALMTKSISHIDWSDFSEAVPAFITMLATPLTFSIATGLSLGLISYTVVKIAVGKIREINRADLDADRPVHPALHLSCERVAVGSRSRSTSKAADKSVCPTTLMFQLPAIASNFPIFAGANQQDADRGSWIRDVLVRGRFRILLRIKFDAGVLKVLASCCSHFGRILSHPSRKDQRVDTAQHRDHGADSGDQAVNIDFESQSGPLVSNFHGGEDFAHVAGNSRDSQQARVLIEKVIELIPGELAICASGK